MPAHVTKVTGEKQTNFDKSFKMKMNNGNLLFLLLQSNLSVDPILLSKIYDWLLSMLANGNDPLLSSSQEKQIKIHITS